jgi:hypothetical protein
MAFNRVANVHAIAASESDPMSIPLINLSPVQETTAVELVAAAAEHGFVFLRSKALGFDDDARQMFELVAGCLQLFPVHLPAIQARTFFHASPEEKQSCKMNQDVPSFRPGRSQLSS